MKEYWMTLRELVGNRPLILAGANVLILDIDNKVLLHHRTDIDCWGLPGGFMELGESVEETAIREAHEELNILCQDLRLFNVYSGEDHHFKYPNGDEVYNVSVTFICRNYSGSIEVSPSEGREAKFFSIHELPENITKGIRIVLQDFKKAIGSGLIL